MLSPNLADYVEMSNLGSPAGTACTIEVFDKLEHILFLFNGSLRAPVSKDRRKSRFEDHGRS
ncbi:hypothetical protein CLAFUW4_01998 [Fulvia fulva]|uniref:Uncharacterized protein n=1 Tax=Passalora fulva TaxID=5499 RepID=A0A9Q8L6H7_PASFU|nr:uncharacterized protein CLAFUR5_01991 [Fulvia fulva]KAK4634769.1 hypothetical protein CLAFUR4_01993 [Fulvia fulva]KAK4636866.1 hypothetical protein CLAFUR0_01995 [Fulvia fulva]UJO11093.1 hypothetical protein CLAFUR5_01991 [Fulvia fulva]WPV09061.1 hypothetical protein CLAFUW4_01998 [Fulvia fulva]WPV23498.1 hypothetical protein CLAFUW7_01998 [Fulvia fulva]